MWRCRSGALEKITIENHRFACYAVVLHTHTHTHGQQQLYCNRKHWLISVICIMYDGLYVDCRAVSWTALTSVSSSVHVDHEDGLCLSYCIFIKHGTLHRFRAMISFHFLAIRSEPRYDIQMFLHVWGVCGVVVVRHWFTWWCVCVCLFLVVANKGL